MRGKRNLALEQRDRLRSAAFTEKALRQAGPVSLMHRRATLQVRQRKIALAVAAIEGAEQREQRRVLRDRQQLSIAPLPAFGREVERKNADFGDEGIGHE